MFSKVIPKQDISVLIREELHYLSQISNVENSISRLPDGSFQLSTRSHNRINHHYHDELRGSIRKIVTDVFSQSEKLCPSSLELISSFTNLLFSRIEKDKDEIQFIENEKKSLVDIILANSKIPSYEETTQFLSHYFTEYAASIAVESLKLGGSESKIFLEHSAGEETYIEKTKGFHFELNANPTFFQNGKWKFVDVRCFIVDGIITSVSEIDTLLQECGSSSTPLAIFARGFDPDVLHTLHVNWIRGTIKCIAVKVAFDLNTVNVLNDIAAATGGDIVSSLKGDLISTVRLKSLPVVKEIECQKRLVTIKSGAYVDSHLASLKQKLENSMIEEEKKIIEKRIKSLSSSTVRITLGASSNLARAKLQQDIDSSLRLAKEVFRFGIFNGKKLEICDVRLFNDLNLEKEKSYSALAIIVAITQGIALTRSLLSIGAGIELISTSLNSN